MITKRSLLLSIIGILLFAVTSSGFAQLRDDRSKSSDLTGPVIKENTSTVGNWANLFNMKMSHSYSMNVGSIGGNAYSLNAYTNTMQFLFNERLTGRLDLSLMHSPFGNNPLGNSNNQLGAQFMVRNAELNYQISEKANITIQFQQHPFYGASPFSPYRHNPFGPYSNY